MQPQEPRPHQHLSEQQRRLAELRERQARLAQLNAQRQAPRPHAQGHRHRAR